MSSSESEDDVPFESIIATRQRRANAGSRLRQLLQLEELHEEQRNDKFATEDDENVNLLFQEDPDDNEFVEERTDDEDGSGDEEEEEGDDDGENGAEQDQEEGDNDVNPDEMLSSESEDDDADEDEDEGEKELQRQVRLKKKAQQKKAREVAPIIKKTPQVTQKKEKQTLKRKKESAESLLSKSRRSSTRASAVENKLATAQRLKESEARRANFKPVERVTEVEMTLEERLAEAVETEKKNILSLTQFYEQEGEKKERQRALAAAKKLRMVNYVSFISHGVYVTPMDEANEIQRLRNIELAKEKKSRRYKKRKVEKAEEKTEEKAEEKKDGDEKKESDATAKIDDTSTLMEEKKEGDTAADVKPDSEAQQTPEDELAKSGTGTDEQQLEKPCDIDVKIEDAGSSEIPESEVREVSEAEPQDAEQTSEQIHEDVEMIDADTVAATETTESVPNETADDVEMPDEPLKPLEPQSIIRQETKSGRPKRETKKVKFADEGSSEENDKTLEKPSESEPTSSNVEPEPAKSPGDSQSREQSEEPEEIAEKPQYEGPPQFVAVSHLVFEDFDEPPSTTEIKKYIFGPQAILPATRRSNHVEPVARIKPAKEVTQTLFTPYDRLYAREFDFILNQMPRFGEIIKVEEVVEDVEEETEQEVVIRTPAPVGIYLPNGKKKSCMISGKAAQYYDPKNGIPYSSVAAFRTLKDLQDHKYAWVQIEKDDEKIKGGIGIFSQLWDGKHAKGVPDWF
ncbi:unnamed protein product [Kuraishia capsulata CBS 1993]|uniref:Vps72/YL1 C-terminal domain-containing protein n=1 Tax=Kuraishia capsulata CBS 1993 TaxID=1382522 RepID=W6MRC6_9ASCO|nr:uncharacterized protein KUCA_T00004903001 [Kuraishia capsulata CBS 1993]CDK28918.1 unnamed protein product [Kuraishia capsulata CBS 1993]